MTPTALPPASAQMRYRVPLVRVTAIVFAILSLHVVSEIFWLYFLIIGLAALVIALGSRMDIPGLGMLRTLGRSDWLDIWLELVCLAMIGVLHAANQWIADGPVLQPVNIGLWKTELVLAIALVAPLAHWAPSVLSPTMVTVNGRRFALEFALYVNFSGIALAFWTDNSVISWRALAAAAILVVLAELTLYASLDDR